MTMTGSVKSRFNKKSKPLKCLSLVLDVDTGRDDAWAILGAFDELEVAGIVSTYGNISLPLTTRNSLDVVSFVQEHGDGISEAEKNIPIWSGAAVPREPSSPVGLAEIARRASINGNGICNVVLPQSNQKTVNGEDCWLKDKMDFLRSRSMPINYIVCGPLTNLANLIDAFGRKRNGQYAIKDHIKNVIVMGGSFCKKQPVDFNFKADPIAAKKVLRAFCGDVFLFPFDETKKLKLSMQEIESLVSSCAPSALSKELMLAHAKGWSLDGNVMLHDPATLLAFSDVAAFETQRVKVVLHGESAGRTTKNDRGVVVHKFVIEEGHELRTRDLLLNQYLNLSVPSL